MTFCLFQHYYLPKKKKKNLFFHHCLLVTSPINSTIYFYPLVRMFQFWFSNSTIYSMTFLFDFAVFFRFHFSVVFSCSRVTVDCTRNRNFIVFSLIFFFRFFLCSTNDRKNAFIANVLLLVRWWSSRCVRRCAWMSQRS